MKKNYFFTTVFILLITNAIGQSVCQEQITVNNSVAGISLGQSIYMADCGGFFSAIEFDRSVAGDVVQAELTILNGQTFLGTPRYTQTVTIPQAAGPFGITLDGGVGDLSFFEDSQYTFILTSAALELSASSDVDSYTDGQLFVEVGFINFDDLWFRLHTTTTLGMDRDVVNGIRLLPNPAQEFIALTGINSDQPFAVYNTLGALVLEGIVTNQQPIRIGQLPSGMYLFKLKGTEALRFIKD